MCHLLTCVVHGHCRPQETKAYSFLASARGLGYRAMPPYLWFGTIGLSNETEDLFDHLEGMYTNVICAGSGPGPLFFLLSKGLEWSRFHSDWGGIQCLFQTKSYQLPSRGESVFTKAGGLIYM